MGIQTFVFAICNIALVHAFMPVWMMMMMKFGKIRSYPSGVINTKAKFFDLQAWIKEQSNWYTITDLLSSNAAMEMATPWSQVSPKCWWSACCIPVAKLTWNSTLGVSLPRLGQPTGQAVCGTCRAAAKLQTQRCSGNQKWFHESCQSVFEIEGSLTERSASAFRYLPALIYLESHLSDQQHSGTQDKTAGALRSLQRREKIPESHIVGSSSFSMEKNQCFND